MVCFLKYRENANSDKQGIKFIKIYILKILRDINILLKLKKNTGERFRNNHLRPQDICLVTVF